MTNATDRAVAIRREQGQETASTTARARMLCCRAEPLFLADWDRVLMIHFEVDAEVLQREVPFELDSLERRAFVSVVAFTMRGMRPRWGGALAAWCFKPIATHHFLNVRTYVQHEGEAGIYFLTEWLSNRLAVSLGPATFGLPYQIGNIVYQHDWQTGQLLGRIEADGTSLAYRAELELNAEFIPCPAGTRDEWLMERYTAFTAKRARRRFFRIWHPPWLQCEATVELKQTSLLTQRWRWFGEARLAGANFSPGLRDVWMGRPHRIA